MLADPLSLLTATTAHNYIIQRNIAKKEIDPANLFQFMQTHVDPDAFCGGPMRPRMFIGMLSRSDYRSNRVDRAMIYYNEACADVDFALDPAVLYSKKKASNKGNVMVAYFSQIRPEAFNNTKNPYRSIMDKLKESYPKKGHTKFDFTPDAITIDSDIMFNGKRHHVIKWIGDQHVRYT